MKKSYFRKNPAGGKGVYLAVAVSAAAVGAVAWLTTSGLRPQTAPVPSPQQTASKPSSEPAKEVTVVKEDVPMSRPENFVVSYPSEQEVPVEPAASESPAESGLPASVSSKPDPESSSAAETPAVPSWINPVGGTVTHPFSGGELVKSETLGEWRTHDGIDLSAASGTPVRAASDGIVKDVRLDSRWGYVAEITHGDITAYYCGLQENIRVSSGQAVRQGDVIGEAGNTSVLEASESPHIHLGMKRDGKWIDPAEVLGI